MERVEGFKKNTSSQTVERFEFDRVKKMEVIIVGDPAKELRKAWARVAFEERDRKAVADLFRKMADSLDAEAPNEIRTYSNTPYRASVPGASWSVTNVDDLIINLKAWKSIYQK
ncbi:hypothetical protein [Amycolatopsis sp. NPDC003731]